MVVEKEKEIQRRMQFVLDSETWLKVRWEKLLEREQALLATRHNEVINNSINTREIY